MEWVTLLIIVTASLGIGYFSAVYISRSRDEHAEDLPPLPDRPKTIDDAEIFRLLRDSGAGGVVPEIRGRAVRDANDLDAEEHAAISMGLVDLYAYLEKANRPALSRKAMASAMDVNNRIGIEADEARNPPPKLATEPLPEPKPPSLNPFKSLRKTTQSELKDKVVKQPESIAIQVDGILQAKLEARKIDGKAVRLLDLPNQGMVIMVGLEKYQDLEDVPDEELRDILRESVAEWETRMLGSD